eukprot:856728-Prymnesium_polylepis.1
MRSTAEQREGERQRAETRQARRDDEGGAQPDGAASAAVGGVPAAQENVIRSTVITTHAAEPWRGFRRANGCGPSTGGAGGAAGGMTMRLCCGSVRRSETA